MSLERLVQNVSRSARQRQFPYALSAGYASLPWISPAGNNTVSWLSSYHILHDCSQFWECFAATSHTVMRWGMKGYCEQSYQRSVYSCWHWFVIPPLCSPAESEEKTDMVKLLSNTYEREWHDRVHKWQEKQGQSRDKSQVFIKNDAPVRSEYNNNYISTTSAGSQRSTRLAFMCALYPVLPHLQSPWYNCTGWLGVKHQFTYLLTPPPLELSVSLWCTIKHYFFKQLTWKMSSQLQAQLQQGLT